MNTADTTADAASQEAAQACCLKKRGWKGLLLHPFFFAAFPLLSLFSANFEQVNWAMLIGPALVVFGVTALTLECLTRGLKNRELAAILTSCLVLFFFLYGSFTGLVMKLKFGDFVFFRNMHRIPLYTGLFLGLAFGLIKLHKKWPALTRLLNVFSVCLLGVVAGPLIWNSVRGLWQQPSGLGPQGAPGTAAANCQALPDIYYIILDGYGSSEVLDKFFGYDNSAFTGYLKQKGFYLPARARSNYALTGLSLGSSLAMDYVRDNSFSQENQVRRFVETNGYRYLTISSMNPPVRRDGTGYSLGGFFANEFTLQLLRTTVFDPVAIRLKLYSAAVRKNVISSLEWLQQVPETGGRKFVFAHIVCPHPPYVIGPNGESTGVSFSDTSLNLYKTPWDDKAGYVNQVKFLDHRMPEVLEAILKKSKTPPVIVLQGDHGPKLTTPDLQTAADMHLHILSAYYLPGEKPSPLYDTITPVNSFRVIFNRYFNSHFPVLEDRCYFSTFEKPFRYHEVTGER